jgi:hypothetical protein
MNNLVIKKIIIMNMIKVISKYHRNMIFKMILRALNKLITINKTNPKIK